MKTLFLIVYLLLLTILVQEARGIRLVSARTPKAIDYVKGANFDVKDASLCRGTDRSLKSGKNRKLVTELNSTSGSSTPSKNDKNDHENGNAGPGLGQAGHSNNETNAGNKEESFNVHESTNEHLDHEVERYPDVFEIAGMDYSSSRRKPSIHN